MLVVRCSAWFVSRCAALTPGGQVLSCDTSLFDVTATRKRPAAIVVPRDLFDADPAHYREIAAAVGALLIGIPSEHVSTMALEKALARAYGGGSGR